MNFEAYEAQLARRHARIDIAFSVLSASGAVLLTAALVVLGAWLDVQWMRWAVSP